jgi:hypothetical protein
LPFEVDGGDSSVSSFLPAFRCLKYDNEDHNSGKDGAYHDPQFSFMRRMVLVGRARNMSRQGLRGGSFHRDPRTSGVKDGSPPWVTVILCKANIRKLRGT